MRPVRAGGGWPAIWYSLRAARRAGGLRALYRALRRKNACKTCALGMGGQSGGMVNEQGHFPEVCKKSIQAMLADMQPGIDPARWERLTLAELRSLGPRELERLGRLQQPLLAAAGETRFRVISWEAALDRCVDRLRASKPDESFFYASGRASNEAAFLWQLFARLYGTNNVNNCSYYCHQASGVGLRSAIGSATATLALDDLATCDLLFLIGGNPASNHPRLMTMLADLRRRGGQVIVINPLREPGLINFRIPSRPRSLLFGSPIASHYLQPHIGGDIALLVAIAKRVRERGAADSRFIADHCEGFDAFAAAVDAADWPQLVAASGVPRDEIERAADGYAASRAAIFAWTMGITHHVHGVDNVRAIANLALLRGMVGRAGAGLLPIRGHSNVQGVGSVGVTPRLQREIVTALERDLGRPLPAGPGLDTLACIDAMTDGRLRHGWCLGGNLYGATPDAAAARRAFGRLDSITYFSTTLNTGHVHGQARETLVLPVAARDEEAQPTTQESMFNFVRLSDGGPARLRDARSEVALVAQLARRVLGDAGPIDWRELESHRSIRRLIARVVPGFEPLADIDRTRREFHIGGRVLHAPEFRTPTGRARFFVTPVPPAPPGGPALRLMTIRSEGQFNTVVYEEEDLYRGQERRDVILMNPADLAARRLRPDQPVAVRGPAGELRPVRVRPFDIRPGNAAMYFPEANVLVPGSADPESRTPAFKNVPIEVIPL